MTSNSYCNEQFVEIDNGGCMVRRQEEEAEPEITLYALVGSPTPGTMRVKGKVQSVSLVILVDSRSTHNFIDIAVVFGADTRYKPPITCTYRRKSKRRRPNLWPYGLSLLVIGLEIKQARAFNN